MYKSVAAPTRSHYMTASVAGLELHSKVALGIHFVGAKSVKIGEKIVKN